MTGAARAYLAYVSAGFRRYSTYRQAMVAAIVTNCVFGFLRCALLLTIVKGNGSAVAGYDDARLATFVWVGQGLIGLVFIWAPPELAERGPPVHRTRRTMSGLAAPRSSAQTSPGLPAIRRPPSR